MSWGAALLLPLALTPLHLDRRGRACWTSPCSVLHLTLRILTHMSERGGSRNVMHPQVALGSVRICASILEQSELFLEVASWLCCVASLSGLMFRERTGEAARLGRSWVGVKGRG